MEYDLDSVGLETPSAARPENRAATGNLIHSIVAHPLTLGLVIHSLADGLALGASASNEGGDSSVSFLVFLALIIHKCMLAF